MKKAFKGFDKDLKCRGFQFVIGETYTSEFTGKPKLCTNHGFHYCNTLNQVYDHYPLVNSNRFCEVEILGEFTEDSYKGITTSLKIIREIPVENLLSEKMDVKMGLDKVRELQTKFPLIQVCGSVGLYLHGIKLDRWGNDYLSDLDIVVPHYMPFDSDESVYDSNAKPSGSDFDETFLYNGVKVDCRIDNKQRYDIIEYKGFKYNVSKFEAIMEAKTRYAARGNNKHKDDIREMCKVREKSQSQSIVYDASLPF